MRKPRQNSHLAQLCGSLGQGSLPRRDPVPSQEESPPQHPPLFDQLGHLSDDALRLLVSGELDPTGSLEVAEHLSFCDRCVDRYSQCLCEPALLSPPEPLAPQVTQQLGRQARVWLFQRFASMAVAASFALVFWVGGVFTVDLASHSQQALESLQRSTYQISQELSEGIHSFWDILQRFDLDRLLGGLNR